MSMIDNRSFRPPQTYLEYLDTDKMRGWAYKSIWNIWTRKKWEAKLKILNEMQMLHLPLKLSHSALDAVNPWFSDKTLYLYQTKWFLDVFKQSHSQSSIM